MTICVCMHVCGGTVDMTMYDKYVYICVYIYIYIYICIYICMYIYL